MSGGARLGAASLTTLGWRAHLLSTFAGELSREGRRRGCDEEGSAQADADRARRAPALMSDSREWQWFVTAALARRGGRAGGGRRVPLRRSSHDQGRKTVSSGDPLSSFPLLTDEAWPPSPAPHRLPALALRAAASAAVVAPVSRSDELLERAGLLPGGVSDTLLHERDPEREGTESQALADERQRQPRKGAARCGARTMWIITPVTIPISSPRMNTPTPATEPAAAPARPWSVTARESASPALQARQGVLARGRQSSHRARPCPQRRSASSRATA